MTVFAPRFPILAAVVMAGMLTTALVLSGCTSIDFDAVRQEQTDRLRTELQDRTSRYLLARGPLSIDECIAIALQHNLAVRTATLQERIAGLKRSIALAGFLPQVDFEATQYWTRFQPAAQLGPLEAPISDRRIRESLLSVQQPVFVPYTWFLYSMFRTGEEIRQLTTRRTRQQIALQTIGLCFRCLALESSAVALETARDQAKTLLFEVRQARAQELVPASAPAEAEALLQTRLVLLADTRRRHEQATAELLEAMGLDPLGRISLQPVDTITPPEGALEDLVLDALLNRPETQIQDRAVAIERDRVKLAITRFLPCISVFGNLSHTSDSFVRYQTQWVGGVGGVVSLFSGFADYNAYRAARARARSACFRREQACLMVMLQVQQAYRTCHSAIENRRAVELLLHARAERLREDTARWRQGLLSPAEHLESMARCDEARARADQARFSANVAAATLLDVLGRDVAAAVISSETQEDTETP